MTVYVDANCVIYFVEQNATWFGRVASRLAALHSAGDLIAVSDLTRAECLVGPFLSGNATDLATYQAFFADPAIHVLPMTAPVFERAARLRADYRFSLPDALHLAAAIEHGCGLFLTNDRKLSQCAEIQVEILN
ncbi:MAG: PIN domain-containing protein [Gemmataceae bacterium]